MAVYLVDFENVTSAGISGIQKLTKEDKVYIFYTVNASNMSFAAHLNLLSSPAEVVYYNVESGGKNALDFQLASFLGYLICQGKEKKFCIISNDRGFEYVKTFWERNGAASDISIFGAPSINRSLLAVEKPFAAMIQQNAAPEEKSAEVVAEPIPEKNFNATADALMTELAKKQLEKQPENQSAKKQEKQPEKASESTSKTAGASKASSAKSKAAKEKVVTDALKKAVKPFLAKAGIKSENEISQIAGYLKNADGKQQFYRNLIALYGMERGAEVYRTVRSEYTNLTKLAKQ